MTNQNSHSRDHDWENHWQNPRYRSLSVDQAMAIALERVPGQVVKVELDNDDGILVYEVDIRTAQGLKYEVKVDAHTGQILKLKLD